MFPGTMRRLLPNGWEDACPPKPYGSSQQNVVVIGFTPGETQSQPATETPCNVWQGAFPDENTAKDGFLGTAPAKSFKPNPFGLFNMSGNVWEWGADAFRIRPLKRSSRLRNKQALREKEKLLKGGSYLCYKSYCYRYRIAARTAAAADSSTGHMGFRVVLPAVEA